MKGEIVMIKAKLFIETNDKIFNPHASIDVELQFIPMRSSLFYLAENHKKALEKRCLNTAMSLRNIQMSIMICISEMLFMRVK